jgi:hypothetical protein
MDLRDISNAWQSGIVVNQLRIAFSKTKIPNQSPCGKRRLLFKLDLKKMYVSILFMHILVKGLPAKGRLREIPGYHLLTA